MKYFFINLILKVFFLLPDWFLNIIFFKKPPMLRDIYLDKQTSLFLKLIEIFGYKIDTENFNNDERSKSNQARLSIAINESTPKLYSYQDILIGSKKNLLVREYIPQNIISDKTMLYFHGGGYVIGSIETHHNFVSLISVILGIRVYSLEYRLAPENKFPCALNDAKTTYQWLLEKGISSKKILLCGDSAGAHLTASLTYELEQLNISLPPAQILIYPMVSPSLKFESMELFKENFLLTKASMAWFWSQLRASQDDDKNPKFNLLEQNVTYEEGVKTLLITAGFDPLCDEGKEFGKHLENFGNQVSYLHFENLFHGFVTFTNLRNAKKATMDVIKGIEEFV